MSQQPGDALPRVFLPNDINNNRRSQSIAAGNHGLVGDTARLLLLA